MAKTESSLKLNKRRFNWPRIFGYDFFISFKLGHPPIGTQSYASDLARRLRELDFTVFFSEDELSPGSKLEAGLVKVLHRSRILVVIANEGALVHSQWVRKEVEEFRRKHPKRQIISINVDRAIETFGSQVEASKWLDHEDRTWLNETNEAIHEGIISPEVLTRLQLAPRFTKANIWFRRMVVGIMLILIGLTSWAIYEANDANRKFLDATAMRLSNEGRSIINGERKGATIMGLFKILSGHIISRSANTDEDLQFGYLKLNPLIYMRETSNTINTIAFSSDGTHIVTGSEDKTIQLWDVKSGKQIGKPLIGHEGEVSQVAYSPDDNHIVSGSWDKTLRFWDAKTGQPIGSPLTGHEDFISDIAFSPDGKFIASASLDGSIRLWDTQTQHSIGEPFRGHDGTVMSIAFSPSGRRLVSVGADLRICLWDVLSGKVIFVGSNMHEKIGDFSSINDAGFSPDGKRIVTAGTDGTLRLWDVETMKPLLQPISGHIRSVEYVEFLPDGNHIVSVGEDKTFRFWDTETGISAGEVYVGHEELINGIALSNNRKLIASVSYDKTLRLWNVDSFFSPLLLANKYPVDSNRNVIGFSPNGKQIVAVTNNSLQLWDANTFQPIGKPFGGHESDITTVAFSPNSEKIASGSIDKTIRLWDAKSGKPIGLPLKGHEGTVASIAFSPDGKRIVSGGEDFDLRLWDDDTCKPIGQPISRDNSSSVKKVKFKDNDHILSFDDNGGLYIYPVFQSWVDEICKKLERNMSYKEWNEWVSPDIDYLEQCPGLPIPPDKPESTFATK